MGTQKIKGRKMLLEYADTGKVVMCYMLCTNCINEKNVSECRRTRDEEEASEVWKNDCEDGAWLAGCDKGIKEEEIGN